MTSDGKRTVSRSAGDVAEVTDLPKMTSTIAPITCPYAGVVCFVGIGLPSEGEHRDLAKEGRTREAARTITFGPRGIATVVEDVA